MRQPLSTARIQAQLLPLALMVLVGVSALAQTQVPTSKPPHRKPSATRQVKPKAVPVRAEAAPAPKARPRVILLASDSAPEGAAFSRDGCWLATAGDLSLWETATGIELRALRGLLKSTGALALSPDGRLLAWVEQESRRPIVITEVASGGEQQRFEHKWFIKELAFSADGRYLVSGGVEPVTVWEVRSGQVVFSLPGLSGSVAISPDGRMLAVAPSQRLHGRLPAEATEPAVRLWDILSRQELPPLAGQTGDTQSLAFSPDGRCLLRSTGRNPQTEEGTKAGHLRCSVPVQSGPGAKPNPR